PQAKAAYEWNEADEIPFDQSPGIQAIQTPAKAAYEWNEADEMPVDSPVRNPVQASSYTEKAPVPINKPVQSKASYEWSDDDEIPSSPSASNENASQAATVASQKYPAAEPHYQVSVPATQALQPNDKPYTDAFDYGDLPATEASQPSNNQTPENLRKQLNSIAESKTPSTINSPEAEGEPGHPEEPEKNRYQVPEDVQISQPHLPK